MSAETSISLNEQANRYELSLGQERVGELVYRDHGETRVFLHTEVDPEFGGRGIGTAIIEQSLAEVRERGLKVVPVCPFYTKYFAEHPEVDDLL